MLGCLCCPDNKNGISAKLVHIVKDPSLLLTISWARLLLHKLANGVKNYREKKNLVRYVGGCVFMLMVSHLDIALFTTFV